MIDRTIASSILAAIASVGLISNAIALYAVHRFKHLHNTFGALCAVLAIANFGDSLIHLLWSAYGPNLFEESTISGLPGKIVGQFSCFFLDLKSYAHLGVSINRLFSLTFPLKYHSLESDTTLTSVFAACPIILAFFQVVPFFWTDDCYFTYFSDIAIWEYADTACNNFYSFYIDFILPVCVYCCIICLDTIALFTLRKARALDTSHWNETLKEKRKMEIGFFIQSLCQMGLSLLGYASFFGFSQYASNDWLLFWTTTVVWASVHSIDGVIMAIFHARKFLIRWQARTTPAGSTNGFTLTNTMTNVRIGEAE